MSRLSKPLFVFTILFCLIGTSKAQEEVTVKSNVTTFLGAGMGIDYGGVGAKFELLPIQYLSFFVGMGYNLVGAAGNVGASLKLAPEAIVCPTLIGYYGYNGVMKIRGESLSTSGHDPNTSIGYSIGGGFDIRLSKKGHKLSLAVIYPFRSDEFMDKYNDMNSSPLYSFDNQLPEVLLSVGLNFSLR